jgi:hypothetical protein
MSDIYNSKLARLIGMLYRSDAFAITTSKNTCRYSCSKDMVSEYWRKHEEVHKSQFARMGWFRFICAYTWEFIKHGYKNNKFEKEARVI